MATVAELVAVLGLRVDKHSFNAGETAIARLKEAALTIFSIEAGKRAYEFFKGVVHHALETASSLERMAAQTGVGTDALQQLGYAAYQADISQGELSIGLRFLSRNLQAAAKGGKEAKKAFADILGKKFNAKKAGSLDTVLMDLADGFARMPDGAKKTALAMQVFGRSGATLIPLLNKGRGGIKQLREEFVALGGQLDEESLAKLGELEESQKRLEVIWQGIKNQIAVALVPFLSEVADKMKAWVQANREMIKQRLASIMHAIVKAALIAGKIMARLVKLFEWLVDHPGLVKILLGVAAAIKAIGFAASATSAVAGLWKWLSKLGGAAPSLAATANEIERIARATNEGWKVPGGGGPGGGPGGGTPMGGAGKFGKVKRALKYAGVIGAGVAGATYLGVKYNKQLTGGLEKVGLHGAAQYFGGNYGKTGESVEEYAAELVRLQNLSPEKAMEVSLRAHGKKSKRAGTPLHGVASTASRVPSWMRGGYQQPGAGLAVRATAAGREKRLTPTVQQTNTITIQSTGDPAKDRRALEDMMRKQREQLAREIASAIPGAPPP